MPVKGKAPRLGAGTWLAPNCTVVGDVTTGTGCSIWFSAVVRGDVCAIHIGNDVNVQDGAVLHGTFEKNQPGHQGQSEHWTQRHRARLYSPRPAP